MLLVADSGSTKTNWLLTDKNSFTTEIETIGFNPFFHNSDFILNELKKNQTLVQYADAIKDIKFFGSGCSSDDRKNIVVSAFKNMFPNAKLFVDHDMLGAALAACFNSAGLVAILGTGSNIAFWNGTHIHPTNHGLGYILGDEGSGSYFGRKLITHFLYGIMPDDLSKKFFQKYSMNKEMAIHHVYHQPGANVYLASFSKFLSDEAQHPYIQTLIYKGLLEFVETSVLAYPQHQNYPVHFIGSIAFHFKTILKQIADEKKFMVGKIIVRPVDELLAYFTQSPEI
ncbi:MAG TPA: N-acetylglucosamine kinase [Bacteroidia bacterium]|jgi:glucosamine kinase|nr:N-acetylglucosamine kinase [Bacteroidia bacterium]HMU18463.1 N-acetylglucosamine kinase [Bacteroidia bacterium]